MASIGKQLLVLAVLAGAGGWFVHDQMNRETVEQAARARPAPGGIVAPARADQVERVVSSVGSGRALRSVELRFSVAGRITELMFEDGDAVEAGEPLARLDAAAERAALAEAEAELGEMQAAFDRSETLLAQNRVTASAHDTARASLQRAVARLDAARTDLDHMTLRAPFAGVVGFGQVDEGAVVASTTPIATLDDMSMLEVEFSVPERFFGEVGLGAPVRARTRIFPDEAFEGVVQAIDRRVDEVSRAFHVRARFENPGLRLPAGAFMQVDLVLESRPGVIAPEEALVTEAGEIYLYVVTPEGRAERRALTLGGRRAGEAEVLEGLAPGETVAGAGRFSAGEGRHGAF